MDVKASGRLLVVVWCISAHFQAKQQLSRQPHNWAIQRDGSIALYNYGENCHLSQAEPDGQQAYVSKRILDTCLYKNDI